MSPNSDITPKTEPQPSAAESTSPEQTLDVDPDGDLLLRVGSELGTPSDIRVCSATMRRASPVWKSMLFGLWKESKPAQGDWVVSLPDDKIWATRILLSIVHGNFGDVPKKVDIVQLHDIVMHANKYALLRVLQPWVNPWIESVQNQEKITSQERLMRAHAAWELGNEELLSASIRDLVWGMAVGSTDEGGTGFSYEGGDPHMFEVHLGPPDLLDIVTTLRLSLVQDILNFFNRELDARSQDHPACSMQGGYYRVSFTTARHCDSVILGRIWWCFRTSNEDLLPAKASEYSKSAGFLLRFLSDIFTAKATEMPNLDKRSHTACTPREKWSKFEAAMKSDERLKNVLQPHHRERLAAQRAKICL